MYAYCNTMKLEDVQSRDNKDVVITVRTTKHSSEWMKRNNVSPTLLFNKALEELQVKLGEDGFKELARWKGK